MKKQREKYIQNKIEKAPVLQLSFDRVQCPTPLKLQVINNIEQRMVIPRALKSKNTKPINQGMIKSLKISRHHIEDQQPKEVNLQFNKKLKVNFKGFGHIRTHSHQIYQYNEQILDDILSDFSNSLQNISDQIIQIPFANKTITQRNPNINYQKQRNHITAEFQKKSSNHLKRSVDKLRSNSNEVKKHVKRISYSKQNYKSPQNARNISKLQIKMIPKPKKNIQTHMKLTLSDFTLKALKIARNGSIIYMAIHNKSGGIYALKSIRKLKVKQHLPEFLMQLKLGLCANHPNINKIYGFFQQGDNIYLIKQLLQEGEIVDQQKGFNQVAISQYLNQIFYSVMKISNLIDVGYWYITPFQMAKSYGILKITNISFSPQYNNDIFSEQMIKVIQYFFDSDRRSTFEGKSGSIMTSSHFSQNQKGISSFLSIFEKNLIINESTLHLFWQHPFLKLSRFKSIMQD